MGLITTVVLLALNLGASLGMSWWLKSIVEDLFLFLLLGLGAAVFYAEQTGKSFAWRTHIAFWALSLANVMGLYLATRASGLLLLLLLINLGALLRAISRLDAQEAGIVWPVTESGRAKSSANLSTSLPDDQIVSQFPTSKNWDTWPTASSSSTAFPSTQSVHLQSPQGGYQPIEPLSAFPSWPQVNAPVEEGSKPGLPIEPDVLLEDDPGVQVELETYKEGENAVPIVRTRGGSSKEFKALMKRVSRLSGRSNVKRATSEMKKRSALKKRKRKAQR